MRSWLLVLLAACGDSNATSTDAAIAIDATDGPAASSCPATPVCGDVPTDLVEGHGLRATDPCAFPLAHDTGNYDSIITSFPLTHVTLADIAGDLNRTAVRQAPNALPGTAPGVQAVYTWQSGDEDVTYWTPQGVTGSFDGEATGLVAGHKLVIVSWYYTMANDTGSTVDKGVRIAIADVTNPDAVTYRFALLVTPTLTGSTYGFAAVKVHAGGLAWVGDRLYVPVTTGGFRVFDLSRILKLNALDDSLGLDGNGTYDAYSYAYAVPELERYNADQTCAPRFSWVSLDRTTNSLVSGEYDATSIHGRLMRWPLDASGAIAGSTPSNAYFMGESYIQGGLAHGSDFYLSSSKPAGGAGMLDHVIVGGPTMYLGWSNSPEDLSYDPQDDSLWSLSEGTSARYLFEVARSAL
ncbi:MAG: hypothetical protein QM831_30255 [Kofleriaceae bacterium]